MSNNTFSVVTDYVPCQSKCQVTINNFSSYGYKLGRVKLRFGYEIYEYEPCTRPFNLPALNMNITCPAWNEGKYIQVNFKWMILPVP